MIKLATGPNKTALSSATGAFLPKAATIAFFDKAATHAHLGLRLSALIILLASTNES